MATTSTLPARRLEPADLGWATTLMAAACADHPVLRHCCPGPTAPTQRAWLLRQLLRFGMRYGRVYTNATSSALAVWVGPGQPAATWWQLFQAGLLPAVLWRLDRGGWPRLRRFLTTTAWLRRQSGVAGQFHYLLALAVGPDHRGQGQGRRLLQATLAALQATRTPCYLDTQVPAQLPFYQRIGFRLTGQYPANGTAHDLISWGMLREPQHA